MRSLLMKFILAAIPTLALGVDQFKLCHERGLKLWLHVALSKDQANKYPDQARERFLTQMCQTLHKDFHNSYEFGISGFGDRVSKSETVDVNKCFHQTYDGWYRDDWLYRIGVFYRSILDDSTSDYSNPLEALPYIADTYFGDYDDKAEALQEMRLLVIITDKPPRYSPRSDSDTDHCGTKAPGFPPTQAVSCDPNTPYLDLKTVFDKFDERYIFPAVMVYNNDTRVIDEWTYVMENSGMPVEKYVRDMTTKIDPYDYAGTVQDIVAWRQCDRIMTTTTIAPQSTRSTTSTPTTTTSATTTTVPVTTTLAPTTTTPTTTTPKSTLAPILTTPAGIVTITDVPTTTAPEHSKVPVIVGSAAAGIAALGAIGAYRFFTRGPTDLDVEESAAETDNDTGTSQREVMVNVNEDSYRS